MSVADELVAAMKLDMEMARQQFISELRDVVELSQAAADALDMSNRETDVGERHRIERLGDNLVELCRISMFRADRAQGAWFALRYRFFKSQMVLFGESEGPADITLRTILGGEDVPADTPDEPEPVIPDPTVMMRVWYWIGTKLGVFNG